MEDDVSIRLMARWRTGDQQAADELFRRFADRLIALAHSRLSARMAQRIDPEDLVQSAYRSFFHAAREGRYELQRSGDLWVLLVSITLHKLHDQVKYNARSRRDVHREEIGGDLPSSDSPLALHLAQEPTPLEAMTLVDEVEHLMRGLQPLERRMLELRLQGYNLDEISAETRRSVRTVSRLLERIKHQLEQDRSGELSP